MARVSGILTRTVVPWPAVDCTSTVPPIFSTLVFTTSMPTPRPDTLVTFCAVENPGRKIKLKISRSVMRAACSAVITPRSTAFCRMRSTFSPAPSSLISMLTCPPSWKARRIRRPARILSRLHAVFGKFDAVVHGIADQVSERILDRLDDGLVEFGLLALHLDLHLLAATEGDVAHRSRKLRPDVPDGLHAGLHDFFLQLGGDEIHALGDRLKAGVFRGIGDLQKLVARQHQFADQRHQLVQQVDADPDGLGRGVASFQFRGWRESENVLRLGQR